ncbi:MAG: hypothetical protein LUE92_07755 [Clostridiales bacterium]|nr:hypothetical protein [Clostridiales bacterium]
MKREKEIYCNCCGKKIHTQIDRNREDYVHLEKVWGYFSSKDGMMQTADICEVCMDQWMEHFQIPPENSERMELFEC